MKAEAIRNKYLKKWRNQIYAKSSNEYKSLDETMVFMMQEYAKQKCKTQRNLCAKSWGEHVGTKMHKSVERQIIRNAPLPNFE